MKYETINIRIFDKFRNQSYYPVISDEAIDHVRNNIKTELKCSPVQGIGVFTIKDIKKGEQLLPLWQGETMLYAIPMSEFKTFDEKVQEIVNRFFISKDIEDYVFVRLIKDVNFVTYNNVYFNSCHPDLEKQNVNNQGIALKDIKKGEELLDDYFGNF